MPVTRPDAVMTTATAISPSRTIDPLARPARPVRVFRRDAERPFREVDEPHDAGGVGVAFGACRLETIPRASVTCAPAPIAPDGRLTVIATAPSPSIRTCTSTLPPGGTTAMVCPRSPRDRLRRHRIGACGNRQLTLRTCRRASVVTVSLPKLIATWVRPAPASRRRASRPRPTRFRWCRRRGGNCRTTFDEVRRRRRQLTAELRVSGAERVCRFESEVARADCGSLKRREIEPRDSGEAEGSARRVAVQPRQLAEAREAGRRHRQARSRGTAAPSVVRRCRRCCPIRCPARGT